MAVESHATTIVHVGPATSPTDVHGVGRQTDDRRWRRDACSGNEMCKIRICPTWGASMKIKILGPIEVVGDGGPLQLPRRQGRLALGILALEPNKVVSVERLLDLMWGDEPPA